MIKIAKLSESDKRCIYDMEYHFIGIILFGQVIKAFYIDGMAELYIGNHVKGLRLTIATKEKYKEWY
jgi:hypothetical protein